MSAQIHTMATAAGSPVSNTTTETSFAKLSLPVGTLSAGKVLDIECIIGVTAQNSTDTLAVGVRFGTNASTPGSNTACAASTAVDAAVGDVCVVRGRLHCQSETRAVLSITLNDADAEGTTAVESYTQVLTLVANTAYYLDVTGTWSAASASDSAQAEAFSVIEVI